MLKKPFRSFVHKRKFVHPGNREIYFGSLLSNFASYGHAFTNNCECDYTTKVTLIKQRWVEKHKYNSLNYLEPCLEALLVIENVLLCMGLAQWLELEKNIDRVGYQDDYLYFKTLTSTTL